MDYLFRNVTAVTMDEAGVLKDACVGVADGKISYVGQFDPALSAKTTLDCKGKVMMPGLYNCHTHTPMTLLRGFAADLNLQDWLFNHIFPAESKFTKDMPYIGAKLAIAEMIASGTVAFTDMYFGLPAIARAVAETGVKVNLSNAVVHHDRSGFDFPNDKCFKETMEMIERFGGSTNGRVKADFSIHAEYTSYDKVWEAVVATAKQYGLNMHIHLSETKTEHEECKKRYGMTPAAKLNAHGVFDVPATCAHCVWLEDADMDILAAKGATAVTNPVSNLKLASGIARVKLMMDKGVNVALGTDGMASNNSHDLFEEIKLESILQKTVNNDPTVLPAPETLKLATVNGALSQGRQNESGKIEPGLDADLILLDFDTPRQTICHDPVAALVYSVTGRDVYMTMCQGRVLYENGDYKTLDIEKTVFEANKAAQVLM